MACWKPGTSSSVDVASIQVHPGLPTAFEWQNATEFAVCPITESDTEYYASLLTTRSDARALSYNATDATWYPDKDYSEASTADRNYLSAVRAQTVGFDTMVTNIAKSWTRYALTTNDSAVAQGAALVPQTYIQVDWLFLNLPAIVFLLSSVFLVATIVLNNRRHVTLWKSSILPLIYHELAEPLHDNQHTTISKMEQQAQSVDVKLQFTDRKLTLHE
ncbi:hypothetical protein SI65_07792 [Aspergillus cristatus]|uniref:Uncharacterized protein n=1 Tax=Aspergillus cristatus TaxID=573508 RepID=A0A1E3B7B7_ASPCR|nr:hypothetical protein SI65_07792 [Aspergillus cristatus]